MDTATGSQFGRTTEHIFFVRWYESQGAKIGARKQLKKAVLEVEASGAAATNRVELDLGPTMVKTGWAKLKAALEKEFKEKPWNTAAPQQ